MSVAAVPHDVPAVRRLLIGGTGTVDEAADELAHQYGDRAGIGIAVYSRGTQLACSASIASPSRATMAALLSVIEAKLAGARGPRVVLLSLLAPGRIVSIDQYLSGWAAIGTESVAAVHRGQVTVILAHVPCFMSWSGRQLAEALVRKLGGSRPLELYLFATETVWLDEQIEAGRPCDGGLSRRRRRLQSVAELREETQLVAGYLHGQLGSDGIEYGYDAWRDRPIRSAAPARKAIALGAIIGAGPSVREPVALARAALARLTAARAPVGDIDDAHLLLASGDTRAVEALRRAVRATGEIVGPGHADQDYFPGVALAALGASHALSGAEAEACLVHYRARFRERPTWPAVWWQLRAWSALARATPSAVSFVAELADWALARQLPSGAFDTGLPAATPSFQTVCVAEGLLAAARVAGDGQRYLPAARHALEFASSLVIDEGHADILPRAPRALGGVRTLHSELALRADAAGHYLAALTALSELTGGE
jgi:hypothetical protein